MSVASIFANDGMATGPLIVSIAITCWLFYSLANGVYNAYFHRLSHIPGPKLWAAFPILVRIKRLHGAFDRDMRRLHQKHGSMVRYGPEAVSFTNSLAHKTVYGHEHGQFPKIVASEMIARDSDILTADDANHARIRRGVAHSFAPKALAEQEPIIHSYVDKLARRLADVAESRQPTEIGRWFHITSFDIIADLTFGESLGGLDNNELHHVVNTVLMFIERGNKLFEINQLPGLLKWLLLPLFARGVQKGFQEQADFTKQAVERRIANDALATRKDFMYGLLRGKEEKTIRSMNEIITNANSIFVAGSDTTATLMTACTFYLLSTPHAHKRAVEEVRAAFQSPAEINFTDATARLPYLLAVLNETFRLYPPVPTALERIVPSTAEPVYIDGLHIPPGTRVGIHQSSAGLSAANFAQPETFAPERWLPEAHKDPSSPFFSDKREAVQPFSYGPRNCVGKHLAYNEMRVIVARLLWEFDMSLDPSSRQWTDPYSDHKSWAIWRKPPLVVSIKNRQAQA
ncbi:hypothetical protein Daus18300_007506 [Diaporthe australafricana]|uniref:Benzoate 4-monooxygenase cytochrome P450 n=1 Tax=Diaporthe australafricana TaxID=127596 RepID=A0ABR3WMV7_9PEZI